jgi:hypothetical protein
VQSPGVQSCRVLRGYGGADVEWELCKLLASATVSFGRYSSTLREAAGAWRRGQTAAGPGLFQRAYSAPRFSLHGFIEKILSHYLIGDCPSLNFAGWFELSSILSWVGRDRAPYLGLFYHFASMKLDTKAMRHLTAEDWRVLTAVCLANRPPTSSD